MAAQKQKKRAWGKTKQRDEITIINREKIEETLQKITEESKKSAATKERSSEVADSKSTMDLQYPELMSNDALVAALKRIKVPIPVYPDGTPSRERLMYLYKTNVMPRPQRNRWRTGRQRKNARQQGEDSSGAGMDVDQHDIDDGWDESGCKHSTQHRKRKLSDSSGNTEGISLAKKISLTPTGNKDITSSSHLSNNLKVSNTISNLQKVRKLKIALTAPSTTSSNVSLSSSPSSSSSSSRAKITWP